MPRLVNPKLAAAWQGHGSCPDAAARGPMDAEDLSRHRAGPGADGACRDLAALRRLAGRPPLLAGVSSVNAFCWVVATVDLPG